MALIARETVPGRSFEVSSQLKHKSAVTASLPTGNVARSINEPLEHHAWHARYESTFPVASTMSRFGAITGNPYSMKMETAPYWMPSWPDPRTG